MLSRPLLFALVLAANVAASACDEKVDGLDVSSPPGIRPSSLSEVRSWAYQIQGLDEEGAADALANSSYEMLVIEPTRTFRGAEGFDTAGLVSRLHERGKLVLAYIDIGEAEDYRTYWDDGWRAPGPGVPGEPDFLVTTDPDGWSGNYPVAYWDERWKDIVIYDDDSFINSVVDDGFDGVYLDWVEAFSDVHVAAAARAQGRDSAQEMADFVGEIRTYGREKSPGFLIVAQNGADLIEEVPEYTEVIDGLAAEDVSYSGAADTEWGDPESGDTPTPTDYQAYLLELFELYQEAGVPVFCVDYVLQDEHVEEAYQLHQEIGCLGYVTQTPLSGLTDTPPPD
jgi:cysteinyl-tRNA synthetase